MVTKEVPYSKGVNHVCRRANPFLGQEYAYCLWSDKMKLLEQEAELEESHFLEQKEIQLLRQEGRNGLEISQLDELLVEFSCHSAAWN